MSYQNTINQITQTIIETVRHALEKQTYYDRTFKGMVINKTDTNTYTVMSCGESYQVSSSVPCEIGDYVRVCAPCNNRNDLFVICKTK